MGPIQAVISLEPTKKALTFYDEFKEFALKGSILQLAIAVIIGTAVGKVVDSLVKSIIMPFVSVFMPSDKSYETWKWVIADQDIPYGLFIGEIVNFVIVSLVLFIVFVKFLNWIMRVKKEDAPPPLTKDQELLVEIRDLLKAGKAPSVP